VGLDIIRAVYGFQSNGYIPHGCNASFITLIPKIENPSNLSEFRPITSRKNTFKGGISSRLKMNRN